MTVIAGIEHEGKVYLSGDSISIEGFQAFTVVDSKVFIIGDMAFGFCGSLRAGQLLRYALVIPDHHKDKSDMEYLVIDFMDAIRTLYRDKGVMKKENDEETFEGQLLLGYRGSLYYIDNDYHIARVNDGYCAVGVASDVALGSLFSTQDARFSPELRLKEALDACVRWNAGVKGPFNTVCLEPQVKPVRAKKAKD